METDSPYSSFKRSISALHKDGYTCEIISNEEHYDREDGEHFYVTQVMFSKKTKPPKYFATERG